MYKSNAVQELLNYIDDATMWSAVTCNDGIRFDIDYYEISYSFFVWVDDYYEDDEEAIVDIAEKISNVYTSFDVSTEAYKRLDKYGHYISDTRYNMLDVYRYVELCKEKIDDLYVDFINYYDEIKENCYEN